MHYVLGCDPGIGNTGLAVVGSDGFKFSLGDVGIVTTDARLADKDRLYVIHDTVCSLLRDTVPTPSLVAIEKVFHNKNISSSITTGKVIGVVSLAAAQHGCEVMEFTPQQVKKASGLPGDTKKSQLSKVVGQMFKTKFETHHEADAVLCAVAGLLHLRGSKHDTGNNR